MIKPGYRTSEFWFTLVSFIFSGLYLTGIVTDHSNKEELISIVSHAVESCILIGGQFVILYKYINVRKNIKEKNLSTIEPIKNIEENNNESISKSKPKPKPKSKSTNKPRTSTKRSRKTNKDN